MIILLLINNWICCVIVELLNKRAESSNKLMPQISIESNQYNTLQSCNTMQYNKISFYNIILFYERKCK